MFKNEALLNPPLKTTIISMLILAPPVQSYALSIDEIQFCNANFRSTDGIINEIFTVHLREESVEEQFYIIFQRINIHWL